MIIRMFEYGFNKAKELSKFEGNSSSDEEIIYTKTACYVY